MNLVKQTNPIALAKSAVSLAGVAGGLAGSVARGAAHAPVDLTKGAFHLVTAAAGLVPKAAPEPAEAGSTGVDDDHAADAEATPVAASDVDGPAERSGPRVVVPEPHAPEEPPVDVVGATLAAEREAEREGSPGGSGFAHEPRAASRDEEHGAAALERATVDEIAEETAAALDGDVDPEPHLTAPLFDAADARSVASELETMSRAADPEKD